jgi:hypothetical protein
MGYLLNLAAADPWATPLPGSYSPGSAGWRLGNLAVLFTGVAVAGGTASVTLPVTASAVSGVYKSGLCLLTGGTGAGQVRQIIAYDGPTRVATVALPWTVQPDATSVVNIVPGDNTEQLAKAILGNVV